MQINLLKLAIDGYQNINLTTYMHILEKRFRR